MLLYTDHQAYSYDYPTDYLDGLPTIDVNKQIKALPFTIYSTNLKWKKIDDILINDFDILPTILNLFGISYNPNYYIGIDIFDETRKNILIFSDGSWYDGYNYSMYIDDNEKDEETKINYTYANNINKLSEMMISNNYYNYLLNK